MNNTINLAKKIALYLKYPKTGNRLLTEKIISPRREMPRPPRLFIVYLTEFCNLNCPFCLNSSIRKKYLDQESFLPLDKIKKIAAEAKKFGAMVYLIGGEPLTHPHFKEAVQIFKKEKILLSTTTNGLLLNDRADFLAKNFDFISVSLDYPDKRHDQSRSAKGLFEKVTAGIAELVVVKGKKFLPNIKINTVIFKNNIKDLVEMYHLAEKLKVDELSVQHFSFKTAATEKRVKECHQQYPETGDYVDGALIENDSPLNKEEVKELKKQFQQLKKLTIKSKVKLTFLPPLDSIDNYYSSKMPSRQSFCLQPFCEITIRANGAIQMCQNITLGNLEKDSIEEVWQNEKARAFRDHLLKHKITPHCFRCCALHYVFN